jgi:membrane associated rhomboid family serine protease
LAFPEVLSVSSVLGAAMVVVYGRLLLDAGEGEGILSFEVDTLVRFGGNYAPYVFEGELFRLGTCIFLHAGIWHLGFNLLALSQVGPAIEEIFGRGRMLLFFMVTGLLASTGSLLWEPLLSLAMTGRFIAEGPVSIGASGAVLGLIGMAAGWGHREGTSQGLRTRNLMLKWCLYTLVFGFFIRADNVAHVVGFVCGGVIGFATPPSALIRTKRLSLVVVQAATGALLALACVALALMPHRTIDRRPAFELPAGMDEEEAAAVVSMFEGWESFCRLRDEDRVALLPETERDVLSPEEQRDFVESRCEALNAWLDACEGRRAGSRDQQRLWSTICEGLNESTVREPR